MSLETFPHEYWMQKALEEAEKALFVSDPNPRVGCILVSEQGEFISAGHTQKTGQAHAEIMALRHAQQQGISTKSATAYVTLEPCSHFGRTPPCTTALIEAGVKQVVIALTDPNPQVSGNGIALLQNAGIHVIQEEFGRISQKSKELNIGFFSRMQRCRPWVRLKMASSLDGKIALKNGESQWITGQESIANGHAWRARASCVLTGVGTILADDPQLNVRLSPTERQPWYAIVDSNLKTPVTAKILNNVKNQNTPVLIYTISKDEQKIEALTQAGATICPVESDHHGRTNLQYILKDLCSRHCNELHVEAGGILSSEFLKQGLVDELLSYIAPRLIGQGQDFLQGIELESLSDTFDFHFHQITQVGEDIMLLARKEYSLT